VTDQRRTRPEGNRAGSTESRAQDTTILGSNPYPEPTSARTGGRVADDDRLGTPCIDCKKWLTNDTSVALHRGPKCRAKQSPAAADSPIPYVLTEAAGRYEGGPPDAA
jgi:hypothetical protein